MAIAILIVIINPNKLHKIEENYIEIEEDKNMTQEKEDINVINEQEEKVQSMQKGGKFCKIGNQIIFYEDESKIIYLCNLEENKTKQIIKLEYDINKMYFDGENIYYIPYYYMDKGIYKVDLQGNIQKIYEGASLQLLITEDEIYFIKQIGYDDLNQNPQGNICKMNKHGGEIVEIAQNVKNYFYLKNDKIYYTNQDRKMYCINKDGSEPKELTQGRKFVIDVSNKYLIYIDYSSQEAKHILNLETTEDIIIGYFGQIKKFQGKTFLNIRRRLDDGSIEDEYTLFEITKNGKAKEIGKIANFGTDLKYISNGKAYLYNQQQGAYTINFEDNKKENAENYNKCRYFLGGYAYKIDNTNLEDIKIERIEI